MIANDVHTTSQPLRQLQKFIPGDSAYELVGMNNGNRRHPLEITMQRRTFLRSVAALIGNLALPSIALAVPSPGTWKTLQQSPVAGFQYHHGESLWPQLATGQPLQLVREADNRFDERAVRVEWQGHKLGYIPRLDNAAVSQLLDREERLQAVIVRPGMSSNPWERVGVEVRWMI